MSTEPPITLSADEYLWFVDQALDEMVRIVTDLGDDGANQRPAIEGANSAYAILTHCLGVMEFWGASMVAGRPFERDREAELAAEGPVADLVVRARAARQQLARDLAAGDLAAAPLHDPVYPEDAGTPLASTQSGVLVHVLRELLQHLGHMEITRDLVRAG